MKKLYKSYRVKSTVQTMRCAACPNNCKYECNRTQGIDANATSSWSVAPTGA